MKALDVTRMSVQALRRYPLRTAMLLTAIAIGVAAVVLLTAVGEGARRYVTGQFSSLGTELLIVLPGRVETSGGGSVQGLLVGETARELTLDDTLALLRSPRVRRVTPLVIGAGTASSGARERDIRGAPRFHYVLVAVLCRWRSGDGAPAGDVSEVRWVEPHAIGRGDLLASRDVARVARMAASRVEKAADRSC